MAVLRIADVDISIPEVWDDEVYFEAESKTWWNKFEGPEGSMMPGIRKDDLNGRPGDTIRLRMYLKLQGAGVTGDTPLEGNEEKLRSRETTFGVSRRKHGIRWDELAGIQSADDLRGIGMGQLSNWLAGLLDDLTWDEVTGNGTTTMPDGNKWAAGTATTRNTIADSDAGGRLTLASISEAKAYAQTELKIPPFRIYDGTEWYGLVVHPYAALKLKLSEPWQAAQRDAMPRGTDNPLFVGADFVGAWDGTLVYSASDRVPRSANTGSVQVADNVFFGSQLYARGYQQMPSWRSADFDYGTEHGVGVVTTLGTKLLTFDTTDAGDAADSAKLAVGGMVFYTSAPTPSV